MKRRATVLAAMLLSCCAGCGPARPPLETWPVRGRVVDQSGRGVDNGVVRLMTDADSHLITVGTLGADGAFEMRTQRQNFEYSGAVAGTYEAIVMTGKKDSRGGMSPVQYRVPAPVVVKPEDNVLDLTIEL